MGMLGAFARGVAGPGLLGVVDRMDRRDAVAQEMAARERDREEERKFRAEQAKLDRLSREEVAGIRKGGSKSGSGSGGDDAGGSDDDYMVAALMDKYGVSAAKAKQMLESSRADTNPFPAKEVADESGGHSAPDLTRWAELNRTIAKAMREGRSMAKSNYAQLTEGDGNAQRNTIVGGMLAGKLTPAQAAEGVAATDGKGAHGKGGVNEFDGTADAVGKSEIGKNNAQAGSANRANRDKPDADPLANLPPGVKERIGLIKKRAEQISAAMTKAQADGMWDTTANPSQARLETELAALDKEARELLKPYLPKPQVDPAQARREAAAAVAAGAPLDRVNARLKEMGLEPINAQPKADPAKPAAPEKKPGSAGAKPSAPELETTRAASGKTMYRYKGQDKWHDSKEEALANLGNRNRSGMLSRGDEMAPDY
mgnify:CR=1 FL=1